MLTRKNYFCIFAQSGRNVFDIHHKLQQIIFHPHKVVLKLQYFIAAYTSEQVKFTSKLNLIMFCFELLP